MTSPAHPFASYLLNEIHQYPGNDRCCDCSSLDTDWASVSHGTLICLDCAGKHRSLGVSVSFVRSITMDTWSRRQLEMMRQGGNGQIRRFFRKMEISSLSLHQMYSSRGADHYRQKLQERVEKIMLGEIKSHVRVFRKARSNSYESTKSLEEFSMSASSLYSVRFGLGPLGLTLTKDFNSEAVVSKVSDGSAAKRAGIEVGDYIRGVAGIFSDKYDEIMNMIMSSARPFTLILLRCSPNYFDKISPSRQNSSSASNLFRDNMELKRTVSDLTPEDLEVTSALKSLSLEMCVEDGDIKHVSSFSMEKGSEEALRPSEEETEAERKRSDEDLDEWVEEEALHVSSCELSTSSYSFNLLEERVEPKSGLTLTVTFEQLPLGLTLIANAKGQAEVLKLREGGRALDLGVIETDILTAIDHQPIVTYHDAICQLTNVQLPVRLTFYRHHMIHRYHSEFSHDMRPSHTKIPHSVSASRDAHRDDLWIMRKNMSFSDVEGRNNGPGTSSNGKVH